MKCQMKDCVTCGQETLHDVGKRMGTNKSGSYLKRRVSRCRRCGRRDIENRKQGKRSISGKNLIKQEEFVLE